MQENHDESDLSSIVSGSGPFVGDPGVKRTGCSLGHVVQALTYEKGKPGDDGDHGAAAQLDERLAARKIVRELEREIRDDVAFVLMKCRKRLRVDDRDVIARTRLGLTLLMLGQDSDAFFELQQVFL